MMERRFTIVEMIVVVVVIILLIGGLVLLLPRRGHPTHTRRMNCAGNLKQIGLGMLMYSGDYDGFFPLTPAGNSFEPLNTEMILPDGKVYGCPSAPILADRASAAAYWYAGSGLKDDNNSHSTVKIAWDLSGNHPENKWMNALFIDGHVEGAKPDASEGWNTNAEAADYPGKPKQPPKRKWPWSK